MNVNQILDNLTLEQLTVKIKPEDKQTAKANNVFIQSNEGLIFEINADVKLKVFGTDALTQAKVSLIDTKDVNGNSVKLSEIETNIIQWHLDAKLVFNVEVNKEIN